MSVYNNNFLSSVSNKLKYEYQEGTTREVELMCAYGKVLWAHEYVLGFHSNFYRMAIMKSKGTQKTNEPIKLDLKIYPHRTVKHFLDKTYQVNTDPLGVNATIQLIDFLNDSGNYDSSPESDYPWHTAMIDRECERLSTLIDALPKTKRADVVFALARIPINPVMKIINQCMVDISEEEFKMMVGYMFMQIHTFDMDGDGYSFASEEESVGRIIYRYLRKTTDTVTSNMVAKEILVISKLLFTDKDRLLPMIATIPGGNKKMVWTEFTFITREDGLCGPHYEEAIEYYVDQYPWVNYPRYFDCIKPGFQRITIQQTGNYQITAYGAGLELSHGAIISGTFTLEADSIIEVAVGQVPKVIQSTRDENDYYKYVTHKLNMNTWEGTIPGCGGTFVVQRLLNGSFKPLIVAGGSGAGPNKQFSHASLAEEAKGNSAIGSSGISGCKQQYTAAAGFINDPDQPHKSDCIIMRNPRLTCNNNCMPFSYNSGLYGKSENCDINKVTMSGGFGGGGCGATIKDGKIKQIHGCGGGYTGGGYKYDKYSEYTGGGGGSYSLDPTGTKKIGHSGPGKCTIKLLTS